MEDDDVTIEDAVVEITQQSNDDDVGDETMLAQNISDPQDGAIQGLMDE